MSMRCQSDSHISHLHSVGAEFCQPWVKRWFPAAETHTNAPVGVKVGKPVCQSIKSEQCGIFECVTVRARTGRWCNFINQKIYSRGSIKEVQTSRAGADLQARICNAWKIVECVHGI